MDPGYILMRNAKTVNQSFRPNAIRLANWKMYHAQFMYSGSLKCSAVVLLA